MSAENTIREDTGKRHRHKYENPNLIHRLVLGRFIDAVAAEVQPLSRGRILDFGCGEGLFLDELARRGVHFSNLTGIDLREDALADARKAFPEHRFVQADVLAYDPTEGPFDLVIASQVLEHLPNPGIFLEKLVRLTLGPLLLTVPLEPWFRLANLARGRDVLHLGNHPEHVNHWGVGNFRKLVEPYASITRMYTVFPFIIVMAGKPVAG